jgi:hypothetical protein
MFLPLTPVLNFLDTGATPQLRHQVLVSERSAPRLPRALRMVLDPAVGLPLGLRAISTAPRAPAPLAIFLALRAQPPLSVAP